MRANNFRTRAEPAVGLFTPETPTRRSVRLVTRVTDANMRREFCVLPLGQNRHGHIP